MCFLKSKQTVLSENAKKQSESAKLGAKEESGDETIGTLKHSSKFPGWQMINDSGKATTNAFGELYKSTTFSLKDNS